MRILFHVVWEVMNSRSKLAISDPPTLSFKNIKTDTNWNKNVVLLDFANNEHGFSFFRSMPVSLTEKYIYLDYFTWVLYLLFYFNM